MTLPWIRLETAFPENPKIKKLIAKGKWRAAFAYVSSLSFCAAHGTDGFIDLDSLDSVHARKQDATDLVEVRALGKEDRGLWVEVPGGYFIPDFVEFQGSSSTSKAKSQAAFLAAKKANCVRWHGANCWRSDKCSRDDAS
jgi:hypothetical protein